MGTAIKCGIVGLGQVARVRHVEAYRRDARCEVVAAYDPDPQKADLAQTLNIPFFTTDFDAFLAQSLAVVSVCSPPFAHAENVRALLNAGIHVLVEKPMAMTARRVSRDAAGCGTIRCEIVRGPQLLVRAVHGCIRTGASSGPFG